MSLDPVSISDSQGNQQRRKANWKEQYFYKQKQLNHLFPDERL